MEPGSVPATADELSEVARAVAELREEVVMLRSQLAALASISNADEVIGDEPPLRQGMSYVLARVAHHDRGTFGERGVQQIVRARKTRRHAGVLGDRR